VGHFGWLAVQPEETPGRALVCAPHRKRRHSCDIFERSWFAVRGNQCGTGNEDHLVGPQHAHGEIGILQWWLAYPQSDVEAFIDDIDAPISDIERDTHLWVLGEKAREDIGDARYSRGDRGQRFGRDGHGDCKRRRRTTELGAIAARHGSRHAVPRGDAERSDQRRPPPLAGHAVAGTPDHR